MDKQITFKYVPFFRLLMPLMAGIITGYYFEKELFLSAPLIISILIAAILFTAIPIIFNTSQIYAGLCLTLTIYLFGWILTCLALRHSNLPSEKSDYIGIVASNPEKKTKSYYMECLLVQLNHNGSKIKLSEKIIIYYNDICRQNIPEIGDSVLFSSNITETSGHLNPYEFNYSKYLLNKGIKYRTYLKQQDLRITGTSKKYITKKAAKNVQIIIENSFRKYALDGTELAILSALFAGDRSMLDDETMQSFINSGAIHLLAVSGLHVGILYLFLSILLWRKQQNQKIILIRLAIIIIVIWFYAFITGLSPSVIRASVMFTLFSFGNAFKRQINSYNIICSSAFLILIFDPLALFQVGLQLSYSAVVGIIYFQPRISSLIVFKSTFSDRIWQLLSVSIAAQITTIPFTLYYFHQFPSYFWLTNILVIPLVWLIMAGTIVFFILIPIEWLANIISMALNTLVVFMNYIINTISNIPGAVTDNIKFDIADTSIFVFACISCLIIYHYGKKHHVTMFIGIIVFVWLSYRTIGLYLTNEKDEIVIYNLQKGSAISIIEGRKHLFLADSVVLSNYEFINRRLINFWVHERINDEMKIINIDTIKSNKLLDTGISEISTLSQGILIKAKSKELFISPKNFKYERNIELFNKNGYYLFFRSQWYPKYVEKIISGAEFIFITGGIPHSTKATIKKLAKTYKIPCHDVTNDGAIRLKNVIK